MNARDSQNSPRSTRAQRARRVVLAAGLVASSALAACSTDSITAPAPAPSNGLLGSTLGLVNNLLSSVTGLLRLAPLQSPVTRSVLVTRSQGGELRIPETGLRLTIPAGAIPRDTMTITVTALAGRAVAYEFQPHGTRFAKPLTFSQDLSVTSWLVSLLKPELSGGYFKDASQVNTQTGVSVINEELDARISGNRVTFDISHFSGYMVSTGRSGDKKQPRTETPTSDY